MTISEDFEKIELGNKLKKIREERNWSKAYVAERAEITSGFLNKIENGISAPSSIVLAKLAKVLNKEIEYFVSHIQTIEEKFEKNWSMLSEIDKDKLGLKGKGPFYLDIKTKVVLLDIISNILDRKQ